MVVIIANKLDPHTDRVIEVFKKRSIRFARFNVEDFPTGIIFDYQINNTSVSNSFNLPSGKTIDFESVTACWYRKPISVVIDAKIETDQARKFALEESQVFLNFLWNSLDCLWVNHPLANRRAESKLLQLKTASEVGFKIPKTVITNSPQKAQEFVESVGGTAVNKILGVEDLTGMPLCQTMADLLSSTENKRCIIKN